MPIDIRSSPSSSQDSHPLTSDSATSERLAASFGPSDPNPSASFTSSAPDLSKVIVPWEDIAADLKVRSAAILISGPPDSGRTWLALSAPGPIAYIDFSEKPGGRMNQLVREGKKIRRVFIDCAFRGTLEKIRIDATMQADLAEAAILDAYTWARSIVVDTRDAFKDVLTYARLGTLVAAEKSDKDKKLRSLVYQAINLRFNSALIHLFRQQSQVRNVHLLQVGKFSEEYVGGEGTGRFTDSKPTYDFDIVLHTGKIGPSAPPRAKLSKPWVNNELRDKEFRGEDLDIAEILAEITGIDSDEWR